MSVIGSNVLAGASGGAGSAAADFKIERSLRFNSADSAYLSRTPSSVGNLKTWTWSGWVKRSALSTNQVLFGCAPNGSLYSTLYFTASDYLQFEYYDGSQKLLRTTQVFRDTSAWMHLVAVWNTSTATAADRMQLYVNGQRVTEFSSEVQPALNTDGIWNNLYTHGVGSMPDSYLSGYYANYYLADVHFVDGQALDATDFGEFDANNAWQPKRYTGGYGWFDDSQTWSSGADGDRVGYPVTNAFDGSLATVAYGDVNETITVTLPGGPLSVTTLRFYVDLNGSSTGKFYINGTDYGSQITGDGWNTITGVSQLTSFAYAADSGVNYVGVYAVEVNGKLLIDSGQTVYADNSFHLDFSDNSSNAALGTDSSGNGNTWTVNNLTASFGNGHYVGDVTGTPFSTNYPIISAFDGNVSSTYSQAVNGGNMTFTPSTAISVSSTLKVIAYTTGSASTFTVNGTNYRSLFTTTGSQTITIPETSITSIVWGRSSDGSSSVQLQAIEVDGSYLIDYTASGNEGVDSLLDTPMDYDDGTNVGGNYCTLNPLDKGPNQVPANGNLDLTCSIIAYQSIRGTIAVSSGKWYWEATITTAAANDIPVGLGSISASTNTYPGGSSDSYGISSNDTKWNNASGSAYTTGYTTGDVIGVAFDADARTLTYYKNGTSLGTAFSSIPEGFYAPMGGAYDTAGATSFNFGQRPFAYTPPTGHVSLCTTNLPDPSIADGSTAMDVALYTGNSSTQSVTGLNLASAPDLLWIKARSNTANHALIDSVRGASLQLSSSASGVEATDANGVTSLDSNGFSLGTATAGYSVNTNAYTYVAWSWDAGSSNTAISAGGLNSSLYTQGAVYSGGTVTGATYPGYGWANAFDANFGNAAAGNGPGNTTTIDLSSFNITANAGEIVFVFNTDVSSNTYWRFNGVTPTTNNTSVSQTGNGYEFTLTTATSLTGITLDGASQLTGVFVAGKRLIDSNVSITTPSIASTVRANASAGFSIVSYTADGTVSTIGHGLNAAPQLIVGKNRDGVYNWMVGHEGAGWDKFLNLNNTNAAITSPNGFYNTAPTSSVFTIGNNNNQLNRNGDDFIAYCFAPVEGYSAFGSYTGNGNADGPFVFTGFKPAFLLIKRTDSAEHWYMYDDERNGYNPANEQLTADLSDAEYSSSTYPSHDFLSNGFKLRTTNVGRNASSGTYIYAAFAEHPFKTARAR